MNKTIRHEILPVMAGTAGHVDHGKTELVKLLTGCDTDRLKEEKQRKLSIDLGFAPCRLPERRMVGIIDVPGHEDFIRNMVAGAASIDVLILVIAADEGVMPQTVEHTKIIRLLRTPCIMTVITKTDLVDGEMLELVKEDATDFLTAAGIEEVPVVCISNKTGRGINDVRKTLHDLVDKVRPEKDTRAFRMNIERVFSVRGYGTVATGIPVSGELHASDTAEVLPGDMKTAVRAIQTYKQDSDKAVSHVCAALNLTHIEFEDIRRGMTVCSPDIYSPSDTVLAWFENISNDRALKHNTEVRFHTGTLSVPAKTRLIGGDTVEPGDSGFVQFRLDEPATTAAGDRYVLRNLSPPGTAGGGIILYAGRRHIRRNSTDVYAGLEKALNAVRSGDTFRCALHAGPWIILNRERLQRLAQSKGARAEALVREAEADGTLASAGEGLWLVGPRKDELVQNAVKVLKRYHRTNPYNRGMAPDHLCRELDISENASDMLEHILSGADPLRSDHGFIASADFEIPLSSRQKKIRKQLVSTVRANSGNSMARANLLEALQAKEEDLDIVLRLLSEEERIKIIGSLVILYSDYSRCRDRLLDLFEKNKVVGLSEFRQAAGLSRNTAVAVLETFDSEGMTKRVKEGRVLVNSLQAGEDRL